MGLGAPPSFEDPRIGEFLDVLNAPLVGWVPYAERARLREETRFHLERLVDEHRPGGDPVAAALREFGPPEAAGRAFLEAWSRKRARGPLDRRLGFGAVRALAAFGLAELLIVGLLVARVYAPVDSVDRYLVDPALFHDLFPSFVPVPERAATYTGLASLVLAAPVVAGAAVGRVTPIRAWAAAYAGVLPCAAYSLLAGLVLFPSREAVAVGLVQLLWWIPAAALSAEVASVLARRRGWRMEARP